MIILTRLYLFYLEHLEEYLLFFKTIIIFSLTTDVVIKKLLEIIRKKNKIVTLAKSKLNSIETLVSQALIDSVISHEEYETIIIEKEKYEKNERKH